MPKNTEQKILNKLDLLAEKLDLYKKNTDEQILLLKESLSVSKESSNNTSNSIRAELKAYQDANKQQLNISLGVLVTAAIAIIVSVILGKVG